MLDLIYHPESDSYFVDDPATLGYDADSQLCVVVTRDAAHRQEAQRRGIALPIVTPPDFMFGPIPSELYFDIETYPNIFTCIVKNNARGVRWVFEISHRRNDLWNFVRFIDTVRARNVDMVGFNIFHFDYPVIHFIYKNASEYLQVEHIYNKAMEIINCDWNARFAHVIWEDNWLFNLVDLFKIHHYDNKSKATSLKILEVHMEMDSVESAPLAFGTVLNDEQCDMLLAYNDHDVDATELFAGYSRPQIELRKELSAKYGENFMNYSDVKIGERILVIALENAGVQVHEYRDGRKHKRQTWRTEINLGDVTFPYVQLERFEFQNIQRMIAGKTIAAKDIEETDSPRLETKGVFDDLTAHVEGIEYKFGTGGLHGSVTNRIVCSDDDFVLVDVDVDGYYPNLAIKNRLYPEHLGPAFCDVYETDIVKARKQYKKKTALNEAFKLAGNGSYGGSNNVYSPLLDTRYTMATTINGQLLLCMFIEQLLKVPGLQMIQANTDGVTYLVPRDLLEHTRSLQKWWMDFTGLTLEEVIYKRMFIRDVNSYIAEKEDGSLKRIGAYAHETAKQNPGTRELPWHKDWSARIVPIAAEAALVRGEDIGEFIRKWPGKHEFMLRTKVPRGSILEHDGVQVANTVRYYIADAGGPLEKVMPAAGVGYKRKNGISDHLYNTVLAEVGDAWDDRIHTKNRSVYEERRSALQAGWNVVLCNHVDSFTHELLNYNWYISEAKKLVEQLRY